LAVTLAAQGAAVAGAGPAAATPATATQAPPPASSDAQPTGQDLATLSARLGAAEQQVAAATLSAQAAADGALRLRTAEIAAEQQVATARAGIRRQIWRVVEGGPVDPAAVVLLPGGAGGSGAGPEGADLLAQVQRRRLDRQRSSLVEAREASAQLQARRAQAASGRSSARARAGAASLAADRARRLLDTARAKAADDAAAAARARDAANTAAALAEQERLAALALRLDAANTSLVRAIAPVAAGPASPSHATKPADSADPTDSTSASSTDAPSPAAGYQAVASPDTPDAARQAALLRVLDATSAGQLPAGYHPTGQVVTGLGSWYGPGFVGSPTSSGTPYDPEQLTCAMLTVPLGTLVRVTTAAGRSVTVLVTDHGPYEPGRVVDLSMRANRAVDLGLGTVRVEVLAPR